MSPSEANRQHGPASMHVPGGVSGFQRDRWTTLATGVVGVWLLCVTAPGASGQGSQAEGQGREIAARMQKPWDEVESFLVEYEVRGELLDDAATVKRYTGTNFLVRGKMTFAFKGSKRYYRRVQPEFVKPLAPGVRPYEPVVPGAPAPKKDALTQSLEEAARRQQARAKKIRLEPELEMGWDNHRLRQKYGSKGVSILTAERAADDERWFQQSYLRNIGRSLPDVFNPQNNRKAENLPTALATDAYRVLARNETIDGRRCVVVVGPGKKVWLDPEMEYAVRQIEFREADGKTLSGRITNRNFVEVRPGLWLPRTCWWDRCGPPKAPPPYAGKPLVRTAYTVKAFRVNDVPDDLFTLQIEPGMAVLDATLLPDGDVPYIMPADPSQLDEVIADAIKKYKESLRSKRTAWWSRPSVWAMAAVVLLLVGITAYRVLWKKRDITPTAPGPASG